MSVPPTPFCPACKKPPVMLFGGGTQAFCGDPACQVVTWNPYDTEAQFWATAGVMDLSPLDPQPNRTLPKGPPVYPTDNPPTLAENTARQVLPLDMPAATEPVRAAAALIAELVRRLNHATLNDPAAALPTPADVGRLLGDLQQALARLPQLLRQVGHRFDTFDRGLLGVDGRAGLSDAAAVASLAATLLDQAAEQASMTGNVIRQAADCADRLTWAG